MPGIRDVWLFANNIIRSSRRMINEGLKPLGLSSAEGNIVIHLLTKRVPLRQEDLAESLDISKPAVSRALESLERKGFVTRQKDPGDSRANRVQLTDRALLSAREVVHVYDKAFSVAAGVLTEEEVSRFVALFERVSEAFAKVQENTPKSEGSVNDV